MTAFSWTCPICQRPVTVTKNDITEQEFFLTGENRDGPRALKSRFIICPNPECNKYSLTVELYAAYHFDRWLADELLKTWSLIPQSRAQSFPDYIPRAILDDYNEVCLILELSPKASATLSRRCLQGIIRDFWKTKVKSGKLSDEIEAIREKVDSATWEAIDSVRKVGNIGAHMEEDINLIIDVEPNEAQLLVELIEMLLRDWYIARHDRETHLKAVKKIAEEKEVIKKKGSTQKSS